MQEHLLQALAPLQSGLVVVGDKCYARDEPLETEVHERHMHCTLYPTQKVEYCLSSMWTRSICYMACLDQYTMY